MKEENAFFLTLLLFMCSPEHFSCLRESLLDCINEMKMELTKE